MPNIHLELVRGINNHTIGSYEASKQLFKGRYFDFEIRKQLVAAVKDRLKFTRRYTETLDLVNQPAQKISWLKTSDIWEKCLANLEI